MKRLTFAITLALVLAGSAFAQKAPASNDPFWGGSSLSVTQIAGLESSPGTMDYTDSICWGKGFTMMSDTAHFTFAPNYSWDFATGTAEEYYSKVTGGSWTLFYNRGTKLQGLLFGEITSGVIEWQMDGKGNVMYGVMKTEMVITGGTGSFKDVGGPRTYGTFTGKVDYTLGKLGVVEGSVELTY